MRLVALFAKDVIPTVCICPNTMDVIQGKYYQKFKDTACELKPYTP